MKKIFSGIQPSGVIHIGNYFGALQQWVKLQSQVDKAIYCIVDMHAITVPQDPKELRQNTMKTAAYLLAMGVDPEKSILFVQSDRPEHAELMWILNTMTGMGQLERMTQYKDKSGRFDNSAIPAGIFNYPTLMAADILLYKANLVPIGDDQKQHLELTRDLAIKFNSKYGQTFPVPEPIISDNGARIMSLDDPTKKMSKSASSPLSYISLEDDETAITNKVKRAMTDSGSEIKSDKSRPAISNLIEIYSLASDKSIDQVEEQFVGKGYAEFKESLAQVIVDCLAPIQQRYLKIIQDQDKLKSILADGAGKLADEAKNNIAEIKQKVGLGS